ncbi:AEN nuclease, partial [Leiothrix lutea]|nr:AEN nuclease [Leiothrix lutea]
VLRRGGLPAAPGGPRRAPGRGSGGGGGGPRKPRSGQPRSGPKEGGPAAASRWPPASQNGPTGRGGPAKTKGKARGAAANAVGAPPVSRNDSAGTGAPAKTKGGGQGTARGTANTGGAPPAPSKFVAMDCEMVGTGPGGRTSGGARCSIVTYEGD